MSDPRSAAMENKKAGKAGKVVKLGKKNVPGREKTGGFKQYNPDELTFALDIGTRTVVGIVGMQEKEKFRVIAVEIKKHENRAMFDGQVHDIEQVATAVKEVKEKLEKKIGMPLLRVAIAASGRVLKTCGIKIEREIEENKEIDKEMVSSIEIEAVQTAQMKIDERADEGEKNQYYCVGYSVVNYYLNSYIISNLIGHRSKKIGVEVLTTFLPYTVIDSLYIVMNRVGIEIESLTLEPIAAINVTIPKDLRMLNLALVDIGAGTSDIAITRDGSVTAYAMAHIAGDEITEAIAKYLLVDFNTAERIKIELSTEKDKVSFVDILRKSRIVKCTEIMNAIKPAVELLAKTITQKIIEYNHKVPNAVFLVGGGSRVPGLAGEIAAQLGLPGERVAVSGREVIKNISYGGKKLSGPESITPVGIAVAAHIQKGRDFITVTLNGKKLRLFNTKRLKLADALILEGYNARQLIGRTGRSLSFTLNGRRHVVKGEHGKVAEILINDRPAGLETDLRDGDAIMVTPAEDGRDAQALISDFIESKKPLKISFNGDIMDINYRAYLNGSLVSNDSVISQDDEVIFKQTLTIGDIIGSMHLDSRPGYFLVNGKKEETDYILKDEDVIECIIEKEKAPVVIKDNTAVEDNSTEGYKEQDAVNDTATFDIIVNGNAVRINDGKKQYIFIDVFNYINFDISKPKGNVILKLNGRQAAFTDTIKPGDTIDIYWDNEAYN